MVFPDLAVSDKLTNLLGIAFGNPGLWVFQDELAEPAMHTCSQRHPPQNHFQGQNIACLWALHHTKDERKGSRYGGDFDIHV